MMFQNSTTCRCVRTSLSVFKLNQICFTELSLVMRHGFLRVTWKPSARVVSGSLTSPGPKKARQIKSCRHVLWCEGYCSQQVLATGPDDQSASLQDPVVNFLLSAQEKMRVVTRQIMAISPQHCTCTQCSEHSAVPGREEHCRTRTTSLFTWSCSMGFFFLFSKLKRIIEGTCDGEHKEGHKDGAEEHPRRILPAVHRSVAEKDWKVH